MLLPSLPSAGIMACVTTPCVGVSNTRLCVCLTGTHSKNCVTAPALDSVLLLFKIVVVKGLLLKLASNSRCSCLGLQSAGMTDVCHYTCLDSPQLSSDIPMGQGW